MLGEVIITDYNQVYYYETLSANAPGPGIFFNVQLSPLANTTNIYFTIALNGVYKLNPSTGLPQQFNDTQPYDVVEFTSGWLNATRAGSSVVNNVTITVVEIIQPNPYRTDYCNYTYILVITNPAAGPPSGFFIVGDPQFMGLRGQSYQVHGIDGAVYNLITDQHFQLNSRFAFLNGPRPCPIIPSTNSISTACWTHPGSYLAELALITDSDNQIYIQAGSAAEGFHQITFNQQEIEIGEENQFTSNDSRHPQGLMKQISSHELQLSIGIWQLLIENNDGFVNLHSVVVDPLYWSELSTHGLLGQTWRNKRYTGRVKEIEGDVDDYLIDSDQLFGNQFRFNQFLPNNNKQSKQ